MKPSSLYFFLYTIIAWFFVSCSNERLQKIGITKKKANQFAISRKAPLEMPPDMLLRPPQSVSNTKKNNIGLDDDNLSLDDILNNKKNDNRRAIKPKIKNLSKEKRILKKILSTKATVLK